MISLTMLMSAAMIMDDQIFVYIIPNIQPKDQLRNAERHITTGISISISRIIIKTCTSCKHTPKYTNAPIANRKHNTIINKEQVKPPPGLLLPLPPILHPRPSLKLPRTLPLIPILLKPLPQPQPPRLRPPLRTPILLLHHLTPKLRPNLRLIHRRQPLPQHLIPDIASPKRNREIQRPSHKHRRHYPLILVLSVHINPHTPAC